MDLSYGPSDAPPTLPLEPDVRRALVEARDAPGGRLRVIFYLKDEASLTDAAANARDDRDVRSAVVASLQATADRSQAGLHPYLEAGRASGQITSYTPFWITNAIAVEAGPETIVALAGRPSVERVSLDHWRQWVPRLPARLGDEASGPLGTSTAPAGLEWNVERVRADEVWQTLGISGTGALVAGIDTGVDWFHPALRENYRGHNPNGLPDHRYSWFDATGQGALYPVDGHGHGTHTLGTAVGRGGIGVAPGADWIGVKVLDNQGYGRDSWIHAGLQWALAPGGDPERAPDVVNCSWGKSNPWSTTFEEDLRALRAANILPVFASGNTGPGQGTLNSPASLPDAFAVGAVDQYDEVANFSSRGPSPWGEIRPHVVAPGVHIRSSMPGGAYGFLDGTSMAAPHVSGIAAVIRAISPTMGIADVTAVLTETAVRLSEPVPNNESGWGRLDAFAAARAVAEPAIITGMVWDASGGGGAERLPIAGAQVRASSIEGGRGTVTTDDGGVYVMAIASGIYDLTASAFAYEPATVRGVRAISSTTTARDLGLSPLPSGTLAVSVTDGATGQPLTSTVDVLETPYSVEASSAVFDLPTGSYTVRAEKLGYHVGTETATVETGETAHASVALEAAPSILLIDGGRWYYDSQIAYYRQALDDLELSYDELPIRQMWGAAPSAEDLAAYDVVIWSDPRYAPGYVGAGEAIATYLDGGGHLLVSGQDVGFWDGGGSATGWSSYYHDYLKARFVEDAAPTRALVGSEEGIFAGETITIAGPGGADNQDYPDVVSLADVDAAVPLWQYVENGCGGTQVSTCVPYRAAYFAFGFEAIDDRDIRRRVMDRAIDWLVAAPPTVGLEVTSERALRIAEAGTLVTHTVRVRHVGQGGSVDEITLAVDGGSWLTELSHPSLTLSPCVSSTVTISVTVPATAGVDVRDVITLTAQSSLSATLTVSATLETKTPASVLLVDDDRWYDQQPVYVDAMIEAGLGHDVWTTSPSLGSHGLGPGPETLAMYPVVVWWTGYDWYAPIVEQEQAWLRDYLSSGGRLFFSSQDYLYYHGEDRFPFDHLGVLTYTQDVTSTAAGGVSGHPIGDGLGPWELTFPTGYQNWSDALTPGVDVGVVFRDQEGRSTALTSRGGPGASVFLGFPFEALPDVERGRVMERSVGWLSWLGTSTFEACPGGAAVGDWVTPTLILRNDGPVAVTGVVSNTVPRELAVEEASMAGGADYETAARRLSWRGSLASGGVTTITYRAQVVSQPVDADAVVSPARLTLEEHGISFERHARVLIEAPDLRRSAFTCTPATVRPGDGTTCTLTLRNAGVRDAVDAHARIELPGVFEIGDGVAASEVGQLRQVGSAIVWSGPLMAQSTARLVFPVRMSSALTPRVRYGVTFISDGTGWRAERPTWVMVEPLRVYLPWVVREAGGLARMRGQRSLSEDQVIQVGVKDGGLGAEADQHGLLTPRRHLQAPGVEPGEALEEGAVPGQRPRR